MAVLVAAAVRAQWPTCLPLHVDFNLIAVLTVI